MGGLSTVRCAGGGGGNQKRKLAARQLVTNERKRNLEGN